MVDFLLESLIIIAFLFSMYLVYLVVEKALNKHADTFVRDIPVMIYILVTSYFLNRLLDSHLLLDSLIIICSIRLLYIIVLTTFYKRFRPEEYVKLLKKNIY